jgi:macrolide transport system ATP-binding/permease protein
MRWTRSLAHRLRSLFRIGRADAELDGELQFHIEQQIETNLAAGMNPRQAREVAQREFGGVTQIREECRDERGVGLFYDLGRDFRLAFRQLRRSPGFSAVVVLSLALGIGANAAIFTLVHAVLLESLPVAHPEQLYRLGNDDNCCVIGGLQGDYSIFSFLFYREMRDHTPQFNELAAFQAGARSFSLRRAGSSDPAVAASQQFVTGNYFTMFGLHAAAGRLIALDDDRPGAAPVAVISFRAWQQHFSQDPALIGSPVTINNRQFTLIGVTPPTFYGDTLRPYPTEVWIPLVNEPLLATGTSFLDNPDQSWLYVIGRVRPATDTASLQTQLNGELQQWLAAHPEIGANSRGEVPRQHIVLTPANRGVTSTADSLSRGLRLLFVLSALLLLIACANIAGLLLARGIAARGQTAVHLALGASRARLLRKELVASFVLALTGGLAAVFVAYAGARGLILLSFDATSNVPIHPAPSAVILIFTLALAFAAALLFGVVPAWLNSRGNPAAALRGAGRGTRDSASVSRRALVVLQVALSLVLLAGAGLFTATLRNLEEQRFGFETRNRMSIRVNPSLAGYAYEQLPALYQQWEHGLSAIPGVRGVTYSLYSPMEGNNWSGDITVQGRKHDSRDNSSWDRVGPHYFEVVGTRLRRGRLFTLEDAANTAPVAIVNETFASRFLPGVDPIGKRMGYGDDSHAGDFEIVGVVEDTKYINARRPARPMFFLPYFQTAPYSDETDRSTQTRSNYAGTIELVFAGAPGPVEQAVRRSLAEIDPNLIVLRAQTFEEQLSRNFRGERTIARLAALFSIVALLLAAVGLYGIMASGVAQRTAEIGLRIALGASRAQVLWMVLREVLLLLLVGLAVGVPAALAATRATADSLYGLTPADPLIFSGSVAVLGGVALLAGFLPAYRASRVDPMTALRYE